MSIIQFKPANCKNCHKCIRTCPVKSIRFSNEQAQIIEDECVLCGNCFVVCPQNAKYIKTDLEQIHDFLAGSQKVVLSLAPSYVSAFPNTSFSQLSAALKKRGFFAVEETAIGAAQISHQFSRILQEGTMDNIITTCCPTAVLLVEKHFPKLLPFLSPVVSPLEAHARLMKQTYGDDCKVVFAGPCISKKYEASHSNAIDAVLMFDELSDLLKNTDLSQPDPDAREIHDAVNRLYPIPHGIIHTIPKNTRGSYKCVAVDGLDRCIETLRELETGTLHGYFFEMSACVNSCVGGPGMHDVQTPFFLAAEQIEGNSHNLPSTPPPLTENNIADFTKQYRNLQVTRSIPDEATIRSILAKIGKDTPEKMFNCSACGYPSCRDKAIAVYQGKADLKMCIPFMREKAESMSNIMLDHTPNALLIMDQDLNLLEINYAGKQMFCMTDSDYIGLPAQAALGAEVAQIAAAHPNGINDFRLTIHEYEMTAEVTVVPIAETGNYLMIIKDVTADERDAQKLAKMRADTVATAQNVIDKQMRVAQEIASLLGETTGQTKAALTKLKKSMATE